MTNNKKEKIEILKKISKPALKKQKWQEIAEWEEKNQDVLEDYFIIAMKIRAILKKTKTTQKSLALQLQVTPQALTRIMHGRQNLTLSTIRRIEKALKITLVKVIKDDEESVFYNTRLIPVEVHYNKSIKKYVGEMYKQSHSNAVSSTTPLSIVSKAS